MARPAALLLLAWLTGAGPALAADAGPDAAAPDPSAPALPAPAALAGVAWPDALWRALGAEPGWPAADTLGVAGPLSAQVRALPAGPATEWARLTCLSGEIVFARVLFPAPAPPRAEVAARAPHDGLALVAYATGLQAGREVRWQALFLREGGQWRLAWLGVEAAGAGAGARGAGRVLELPAAR